MRWKAAAQAVSWILELSDSVCSLKGSIVWHTAASLLMLRRRKERRQEKDFAMSGQTM